MRAPARRLRAPSCFARPPCRPRGRAGAQADHPVRSDRGGAALGLRAAPDRRPFQSRGPLGGLFAWVLDKQQGLQRTLATSVKGLKTDNPMAGALTLAALSFLYGILHAVGPGHGKTIISSYVVANEETVRRGVIISFIAAGLQALTAVALVGLLLFGLNASGLQINAWSNQLESVSYAMIALVGLYLADDPAIAALAQLAWRAGSQVARRAWPRGPPSRSRPRP